MRRLSALSLVLALVLVGCSTGTAHLTPLDDAKRGYVDASIAYEATMKTLVDLRAKHLVTDAQWQKIDTAQHVVEVSVPNVRDMLAAWEATGTKPILFDAVFRTFLDAFQAALNIELEVKK